MPNNPKVHYIPANPPRGLSDTVVLVNQNWTQILNFFTAKIGFLCNAMDVLIHPCLVGWSVSGME